MKIFFIGESIQLFESDRRVEVQGAVLRDKEVDFYQVKQKPVLILTFCDFDNKIMLNDL